jgi:hypothetical protein
MARASRAADASADANSAPSDGATDVPADASPALDAASNGASDVPADAIAAVEQSPPASDDANEDDGASEPKSGNKNSTGRGSGRASDGPHGGGGDGTLTVTPDSPADETWRARRGPLDVSEGGPWTSEDSAGAS